MKRVLPFATVLGLAGAAGAGPVFEQGFSCPGGDYASAPVENAETCARLCHDDGLCTSWTFDAGQCALKAVIAPAVAKADAISGLAARAPTCRSDQLAANRGAG
jgi:hypothetical protein